MEKIIVLIDPVAVGVELVQEARLSYQVIIVYTIGEERAKKYVPNLPKITQQALEVIYAENVLEIWSQLDPNYRKRIAGVIPASEPGVELASDLAADLGCVHLNSDAARICRNKGLIRNKLRELNLPTVDYERCMTIQNCKDFVAKHSIPVVLKHPSSAGQNNIFICHSLEEVERAFHAILSAPNIFGQLTDHVLIEEYLNGPECAVNFIVAKRKIRHLDTWKYDHYLFDERNRLYDNISLYQERNSAQKKIEKYAEQVVKALDIDNGFVHLEVIDDEKKGPVLVDIGARMMGGYFTELILKLKMANPFGVAIKLYTGQLDVKDVLYHPNRSMSGVFLPIYDTGELKKVQGVGAIKRRPGYAFHYCAVKAGDQVSRSEELGNMAASFYISAPNDEKLREEIRFIRENFKLVYKG